MHQYSPFFKTLHDETQPAGYLGQGVHYSVLRCVTWHGQSLEPLNNAAFHDFAIIWDEDHDTRIIPVIECLYFRGLLAPALFVGESKGLFTLLTVDSLADNLPRDSHEAYAAAVAAAAQPPGDDQWPANVRSFSHPEGCIIEDAEERVALYLNSLRQLWQLGLNPIGQCAQKQG